MKSYGYLLSLMLLVLFACSDDDEAISVPGIFEFKDFVELEGINLNQAPGLLGDQSTGALYLASRQPHPETGILGENVIRFDLDGNKVAEYSFEHIDFITKNPHVIGDELFVLGGSFLNIYDLDLSGPPVSIPHGLSISRFGSAVYEGELYFWGGDLREVLSDVLWKWDARRDTIVGVAQLPGPKTYANGEVFGDRLFVFGGREEFLDTRGEDEIYVYQFTDTTAATFDLPERVARTFTAPYRDLIIVSGQLTAADGNPDSDDLNIFFGVYNPVTFGFQSIPTNLSDEGNLTIHQMATVGDRLFIIYGEADEFGGGLKIMSAEL